MAMSGGGGLSPPRPPVGGERHVAAGAALGVLAGAAAVEADLLDDVASVVELDDVGLLLVGHPEIGAVGGLAAAPAGGGVVGVDLDVVGGADTGACGVLVG